MEKKNYFLLTGLILVLIPIIIITFEYIDAIFGVGVYSQISVQILTWPMILRLIFYNSLYFLLPAIAIIFAIMNFKKNRPLGALVIVWSLIVIVWYVIHLVLYG
jgi:hypothetical protein